MSRYPRSPLVDIAPGGDCPDHAGSARLRAWAASVA